MSELHGEVAKKLKGELDIDENLVDHNEGKHVDIVDSDTQRTVHALSNFQPTQTTLPAKPLHGSDEWHKQRKENHKNVEKRRRENINMGIKELAALIPTPDTNKSQILQRAVEYIKRLKENETNNIEKWTLEKLLTEQAVTELDNSNQKLKLELEKCYREIENYKKLLEKK